MGDEEQDESEEEDSEEGEETEEEEVEEKLTSEDLRRLHGRMDGNGDGSVSLQEILNFSHATARRKAYDEVQGLLASKKDGKWTLEDHLKGVEQDYEDEDPEEVKHIVEKETKLETEKFHAADIDGDGLLERDEFVALTSPETNDLVLEVIVKDIIQRHDVDQDGKLSFKELWANESLSKEEEAQQMSEFVKVDLNHDGYEDYAELMQYNREGLMPTTMSHLLSLIDKDHDDLLSADEFSNAESIVATHDARHHLLEWLDYYRVEDPPVDEKSPVDEETPVPTPVKPSKTTHDEM